MKIRNNIGAAFLVLILSMSCKEGNAKPDTTNNRKPSTFRVVGYLREVDVANGEAIKFDFSKITHLNIAFLNPDSTGNFNILPGLSEVINIAHAKNVKVLASIGGGNAPSYYTTLTAKGNRDRFIKNLAQLTDQYGLDGIDVDLEGTLVDSNYEGFVIALKALLKPKAKLLTSAIATAYATQYTDKALAQYDFVNIMSYDKTGPWNRANSGPHSPYSMAVDDLNYWGTTRGLSKEKLNLGLPFYGYGFGPGAPEAASFQIIINQYSGSVNKDEVTVSGGGTIYYNGISTIKNKTAIALQKAGGVMIWQLLQDASGAYSLLNAINAEINSTIK